MNVMDDEQFIQLIRKAVAPLSGHELQQDLWPRMLLKLNDPGIHVPWYDWVLAAAAVVLSMFMPEAIPGLLYNL